MNRNARSDPHPVSTNFLTVAETESGEDAQDPGAELADEAVLAASISEPGLFGVLVDRYRGPFFRLAQRVVRDQAEAQDVVQDAFVKMYRYAGRFRQGEDRKFSSWAYKIVFNTAITHYHRMRRGELLLPEDGDPTAAEAHAQFREALLERETEERVRSVLAVMPEELARLLRSYYLEDKSYQIIAASTGLSIGALKMKLFRARKLFKKLLVG